LGFLGGFGYFTLWWADLSLPKRLAIYMEASIALNLKNHYRLGFKYTHLSNGGLGPLNPGTEQLTIALKIPYK